MRLDHLLSRENFQFELKDVPCFLFGFERMIVFMESSRFWKLQIKLPKALTDNHEHSSLKHKDIIFSLRKTHNHHGPVAQFGQSARLISVRPVVQVHPGPP